MKKIATVHPTTPMLRAYNMARRLGCHLRFIDGRVWLCREVSV